MFPCLSHLEWSLHFSWGLHFLGIPFILEGTILYAQMYSSIDLSKFDLYFKQVLISLRFTALQSELLSFWFSPNVCAAWLEQLQ